MNISTDQRGAVLFLTILVMGTLSISVLLGLTQGSLNAIVDSNQQVEALATRQIVRGCLQEVFIQIVGDSSWTEGSVTTSEATCNVSFVPGDPNTDILVTWSSGTITQGMRVSVTRSPFSVHTVEEALAF